MKAQKLLFLLATLTMLVSCESNKKYDPYAIPSSPGKTQISKGSFEVAFKKTDANLKTIHINLNGNNSYDAIFDSGCSGVSISVQEAIDMIKQETLHESDELQPIKVTIADGSSTLKRVFNLREVTVMDKNGKPHTLRDIPAVLEPNIEADILIGTSVIDNLAKKSYTVDLKKRVIRFE